MDNRYSQGIDPNSSRFSSALFAQAERSKLTPNPVRLTTFNAGEIVPIYCKEILPEERLSLSLDEFVIRQTTLLTPTMGKMDVTFYSFFVPNRVVNASWKAVEGENYSGSWVAPQVSLVPLKAGANLSIVSGSTQIPVGSVADHYGFPTQAPISNLLLHKMHDLKFRGYVAIYNEYFRDQNYQPPIPISYLNVYQGFLDSTLVGLSGGTANLSLASGAVPDGSAGAGAVQHALRGSTIGLSSSANLPPSVATGRFRATQPPLKANRLHDYFSSVLPSPQKSSSPVFAAVSGSITPLRVLPSMNDLGGSQPPLRWRTTDGNLPSASFLGVNSDSNTVTGPASSLGSVQLFPSNLWTQSTTVSGLEISVDEIRMAAAIQQCYEILARGGSRYRSIVQSFFGVDVDDPFDDIPKCLGKVSRSLDLYQTAQTAASQEGSTPQGNLAGFGYTSSSCQLFPEHRFLEHGYVHVFAVVRHRNIYSSFLSKDNFRTTMLDYYMPPLANISEQPVYTYEINPFYVSDNVSLSQVFGYQEAWSEYRFEPDTVTGYMRPGIDGSLSLWNYADDVIEDLDIASGEWLKSNSAEVLDRTLAVKSDVAPQFKAMFSFRVSKELPMPTFSVPGLDII